MAFPSIQNYSSLFPLTSIARAPVGFSFRPPRVNQGSGRGTWQYQFFATGTSTPQNVYQDGALSVPFSPTGVVTADVYGRFPAIYLDNSIAYKVQLYNQIGTLQRTTDPYNPAMATTGFSQTVAIGMVINSQGEITLTEASSGGNAIEATINASAAGTAAVRLMGNQPGLAILKIDGSATTGAQTATFTATNKPGTATSSPAGWLPINCDGTVYYIPIWHGNNFSPYVYNGQVINGQTISATTVEFDGDGTTTLTGSGASAAPAAWQTPPQSGVGANFWINVTKTSGLSGLAFVQSSGTPGTWTNIGAGGLTISANAAATIGGTYQLSSSSGGTPVVASGTITLSNNNGPVGQTYNGAPSLVLGGNGTATLNGTSAANWYSPTTSNVGASYWINITRTGGSGSTTFTAAVGAWTNITNSGLTIGLTTANYGDNATGTYQLSSNSGGTAIVASGSITLTVGPAPTGASWSGNTTLVLNGNGTVTLGGSSSTNWYNPTTSNVGNLYFINITKTSGTPNFSAAQGSWTNISNSGLTIDLTNTLSTYTVSGTYQISPSGSGSPVVASGSISLTKAAGTVQHIYSTAGSGTETIPTWAVHMDAEAFGGAGGGGGGGSEPSPYYYYTGGGGGSGGYCRSYVAIASGNWGQTVNYTVGAAGAAASGAGANGGNGGNSTISSGTFTIATMTAGAGGGGQAFATAGTAGTAAGGSTTNTGGNVGGTGGLGPSIGQSAGGAGVSGANGVNGGAGGLGGIDGSLMAAGGVGIIVFTYS